MGQNEGMGCFHLCLPEVQDIFIQHKPIGHQGARESQRELDREPALKRLS